ncbi:MAG: hypothetical protein HC800_25540 [Phormidesmis sp. RL_2_1]|nr:hypothetical protein [Phormidesmis sp. RL_2_1]
MAITGKTRAVDADGTVKRVKPPYTSVQLGNDDATHTERKEELVRLLGDHDALVWRGQGSISRFLQAIAEAPVERQPEIENFMRSMSMVYRDLRADGLV